MHDDPTMDPVDGDGDDTGEHAGDLAIRPFGLLDAAIDRVYRLARTVGFVAVFILAAMAALGFVYTSPGKRITAIDLRVERALVDQRRTDSLQTLEMHYADSVESAKLDKLTRLVFFMIYDQCQRQTQRTDLDLARCRDIYRTMRPDP